MNVRTVDSGEEWLGEVPSHWKITSIKHLSPVLRGASPRPIDDPRYFDDNGEYAWVRIADVSKSNGLLCETTQTLSELGSSLSVRLERGALFVSIAGTVGKPCIAGLKVCIHDGFVYFPRLKLDPKFLFRIFEAGECYRGLGKFGTQLNLNTDTIGSIKVAVPPDDEVADILRFLDRETAKIDALVEEQKRLIDLLKEKRQAVISHAVTKGLNPDAPMKDSGIEWLGEVPEHWEVKPLKHMVSHVVDCLHTTPSYEGDLIYPAIRTADVERGILLLDQARLVSEEVYSERIQRLKPEAGDILYSREGERFGMAVLVPPGVELCLGQRMMMFRSLSHYYPGYIMWALNSEPLYQQVLARTAGAMAPHANIGDLVNFRVPCPPKHEQLAISEEVTRAVGRIDDLSKHAQRAISLLSEHRSALISSAVTGKIDVRAKVDKEVAA